MNRVNSCNDLCHDDSTINIVVVIIIIIIITVIDPLIVCDDCAAGISPLHQPEASQSCRRRTRSSHSTDAFESLPVKTGDV